MANIVGIIPARMGSSRFPGKPMYPIAGVPMIGHCYFRSAQSRRLDDLYVATCDEEIAEYIESVGGKAVMTSDSHTRASDRTAEALGLIERQTGKRVDFFVMIQGGGPGRRPGGGAAGGGGRRGRGGGRRRGPGAGGGGARAERAGPARPTTE